MAWRRRRRVWATWISIWIVVSVAVAFVFIGVADSNRAKRVEHLEALSSSRDGVCGEVLHKYTSWPVYEYMVRWHSEDPPAGMPATFDGRFCGSVTRYETAVRTRQRDGSFDVALPGETNRVEAGVFAVIVGGFATLVAAIFFHRRRPLSRRSASDFGDGARV